MSGRRASAAGEPTRGGLVHDFSALVVARRVAHGGAEHGAEGAEAFIAAVCRDGGHGLAAGQPRQRLRDDHLLAPLQPAQAKLLAEQTRQGAFARAHAMRPLGQRAARVVLAQHGMAQRAQALVAALGVGQGHAQRLGVGKS